MGCAQYRSTFVSVPFAHDSGEMERQKMRDRGLSFGFRSTLELARKQHVKPPQPPYRLTLDLALDPVLLLFPPQLVTTSTTPAFLPLSVTTTPLLPFGTC